MHKLLIFIILALIVPKLAQSQRLGNCNRPQDLASYYIEPYLLFGKANYTYGYNEDSASLSATGKPWVYGAGINFLWYKDRFNLGFGAKYQYVRGEFSASALEYDERMHLLDIYARGEFKILRTEFFDWGIFANVGPVFPLSIPDEKYKMGLSASPGVFLNFILNYNSSIFVSGGFHFTGYHSSILGFGTEHDMQYTYATVGYRFWF